jgi:hypothetical protein
MGLLSNASAWPFFNWLDTNLKIPDANYGGYEHWGVLKGRRQPDNAAGGEWCAGANFSMAYAEVWGWSDANCTGIYPYICRTSGGAPRASRCPLPPLAPPLRRSSCAGRLRAQLLWPRLTTTTTTFLAGPPQAGVLLRPHPDPCRRPLPSQCPALTRTTAP